MLADMYIESVLAKCEALKKAGIWPLEPQIRPDAWLSNFKDPQERLLAAILLDNFVFYSERASARLLASAYDRLEDDVILGRIPVTGTPSSFLRMVVFTPVEGETPRPTDSGNMICKKLRDIAELDDERFLDPAVALDQVIAGMPVVFVDDFIGSGSQLTETWCRAYRNSSPASFKAAYNLKPFTAICLAMVATQTALENITREAPGVQVITTHILDDGYSVSKLAAPSLTPPFTDFQGSLRALLAKHVPNLDLPPYLIGDHALFGFHELGLLFAIQGGIPDSTVPLLWASGHGSWIRLMRKNV